MKKLIVIMISLASIISFAGGSSSKPVTPSIAMPRLSTDSIKSADGKREIRIDKIVLAAQLCSGQTWQR